MNPMGHSIAKTLRDRRVCPHCKKVQIVASAKKNIAVACKACGKPVPPAKGPRR